jgi:hypothetical protein
MYVKYFFIQYSVFFARLVPIAENWPEDRPNACGFWRATIAAKVGPGRSSTELHLTKRFQPNKHTSFNPKKGK